MPRAENHILSGDFSELKGCLALSKFNMKPKGIYLEWNKSPPVCVSSLNNFSTLMVKERGLPEASVPLCVSPDS